MACPPRRSRCWSVRLPGDRCSGGLRRSRSGARSPRSQNGFKVELASRCIVRRSRRATQLTGRSRIECPSPTQPSQPLPWGADSPGSMVDPQGYRDRPLRVRSQFHPDMALRGAGSVPRSPTGDGCAIDTARARQLPGVLAVFKRGRARPNCPDRTQLPRMLPIWSERATAVRGRCRQILLGPIRGALRSRTLSRRPRLPRRRGERVLRPIANT